MAACLCEVAETLSPFLYELFVVCAQLVQEDWNELVNVVHDLGLARDVEDLIQGDEDTELFIFPWAFQLQPEFLKDVVCLLRVLLEVLEQLYGGLLLHLHVLVLEVEPNTCKLHIYSFLRTCRIYNLSS